MFRYGSIIFSLSLSGLLKLAHLISISCIMSVASGGGGRRNAPPPPETWKIGVEIWCYHAEVVVWKYRGSAKQQSKSPRQ